MTRFPSRLSTRSGEGRIELRQGGGCLVLFGLPFLASGLFVAAGAAGLVPVDTPPGPERLGLALFGAVFAIAGGVLMGLRWGTTLDAGAGTATSWWRLLGKTWRRVRPLVSFRRVLLRREARDRSVRYVVELGSVPGGDVLKVGGSGDMLESRRLAEEVADTLGLPLRDTTSGVPVEREAGRLDEGVAARGRRTGQAPLLPGRPYPMRSRVEERAGGTTITIPGPGIDARALAGLLPAAVFLAVAAVVFRPVLRVLAGTRWFAPVAGGFALLVLGPAVLRLAARAAAAREDLPS